MIQSYVVDTNIFIKYSVINDHVREINICLFRKEFLLIYFIMFMNISVIPQTPTSRTIEICAVNIFNRFLYLKDAGVSQCLDRQTVCLICYYYFFEDCEFFCVFVRHKWMDGMIIALGVIFSGLLNFWNSYLKLAIVKLGPWAF